MNIAAKVDALFGLFGYARVRCSQDVDTIFYFLGEFGAVVEDVKMRSKVLAIVAICLALAVGTAGAGRPKPQAASAQRRAGGDTSPVSPIQLAQITAARLPAPVTETELNTAKLRCALLRFFTHEREALDLLGLARFDRPGAGTSWGYSYSQGYELGNGHWLLLWYSTTS